MTESGLENWCTEAVYASLRGVLQVQQGFIGSDAPHDFYSEAVLVDFDSTVIPLDILIRKSGFIFTPMQAPQRTLCAKNTGVPFMCMTISNLNIANLCF